MYVEKSIWLKKKNFIIKTYGKLAAGRDLLNLMLIVKDWKLSPCDRNKVTVFVLFRVNIVLKGRKKYKA